MGRPLPLRCIGIAEEPVSSVSDPLPKPTRCQNRSVISTSAQYVTSSLSLYASRSTISMFFPFLAEILLIFLTIFLLSFFLVVESKIFFFPRLDISPVFTNGEWSRTTIIFTLEIFHKSELKFHFQREREEIVIRRNIANLLFSIVTNNGIKRFLYLEYMSLYLIFN